MKAAFITGIAGGIGSALGRAFREAGYFVVGCDRREGNPDSFDVFLQFDIEELAMGGAALNRLFALTFDAVKGHDLHVLVNNAAEQRLGSTLDILDADWQSSLNVNVTAPMKLSQMCLPMLELSRGSIINIGSVHSRATKPGFVAYATSKAALEGLTRAMAVDLGHRCRVNCIAPAAIATPMLLAGFEGKPEKLALLEGLHPAGRIGLPSEVADAAVFLASAQAAFITGATFQLDGGISGRLHDPI